MVPDKGQGLSPDPGRSRGALLVVVAVAVAIAGDGVVAAVSVGVRPRCGAAEPRQEHRSAALKGERDLGDPDVLLVEGEEDPEVPPRPVWGPLAHRHEIYSNATWEVGE